MHQKVQGPPFGYAGNGLINTYTPAPSATFFVAGDLPPDHRQIAPHDTLEDIWASLTSGRRPEPSEPDPKIWALFAASARPDSTTDSPPESPPVSRAPSSPSSSATAASPQATKEYRFVNGPKRTKQEICDRCGQRNSNLRRHKRTKCRPPGVPLPSFVCQEDGCDLGFTRKEYLKRHQKQAHGVL